MTYNVVPPGGRYRRDIDGLRAIAIVAVIVFHAFPASLVGGFLGVDIFLVISGFLISTIIFREQTAGHFSFADFYARRCRRILPALIAVLLAGFVVGWHTLMPSDFRQLGKQMLAAALFISNIQFWFDTGYFDQAAELKPLLHLWSLSIEEQFYILWPPILVWALGRGVGVMKPVALLALASLMAYILAAGSYPEAAFFLPFGRFWELLAGGMLARWRKPAAMDFHLPSKLCGPLAVLGISVIFAALFSSAGDSMPVTARLLVISGTCLLIASGPDNPVAHHVLGRSLAVQIGKISYPLYLWHWPLLSFLRITSPDGPTAISRAIAMLLSVVLAVCTYQFIERPIRFGRARRLGGFALPTLLLLLGCVGAACFQNGGFAFRIPVQIRRYVSTEYDWSEHARVGTCWLSNKAGPNSYDPSCFEGKQEGRRSVLIWGDSHAGRLYPGLADVFGGASDIGQLTRDICPPILGFGYTLCIGANAYVLSRIEHEQPDVVILFAAWNHYAPRFEDGSMSELLELTIKKLLEIGTTKIVVIGPPPQWTIGLPRVLANTWFEGWGLKSLPTYEKKGLTAEAFMFDRDMKTFLSSKSVQYVSLLDLLCNRDVCLTKVDDGPDGLLTADYGHLTHAASDYVANRLRALAPAIAGP